MDYRLLLKKYIDYVFECEGTNFIEYGPNNYRDGVRFSEEEWAELKRLDAEELPTQPVSDASSSTEV